MNTRESDKLADHAKDGRWHRCPGCDHLIRRWEECPTCRRAREKSPSRSPREYVIDPVLEYFTD